MFKQVIVPPLEGWKRLTYYVVELAFSEHNPIHEAIINTGFLDDEGNIQNIKIFNDTYDRVMNLEDVVFLRASNIIDIQESSNSMKLPTQDIDIESVSMQEDKQKRISDVMQNMISDSIVLGSGVAITDKYSDIKNILHEIFLNKTCDPINYYRSEIMMYDICAPDRHYEIKSKQRSIEDQKVFMDLNKPNLKDRDGWYRMHDKKSKKNKF